MKRIITVITLGLVANATFAASLENLNSPARTVSVQFETPINVTGEPRADERNRERRHERRTERRHHERRSERRHYRHDRKPEWRKYRHERREERK